MLMNYLIIGLIYADFVLIKNIFFTSGEYKDYFENSKLWIKILCYFADLLIWPIGIANDFELF